MERERRIQLMDGAYCRLNKKGRLERIVDEARHVIGNLDTVSRVGLSLVALALLATAYAGIPSKSVPKKETVQMMQEERERNENQAEKPRSAIDSFYSQKEIVIGGRNNLESKIDDNFWEYGKSFEKHAEEVHNNLKQYDKEFRRCARMLPGITEMDGPALAAAESWGLHWVWVPLELKWDGKKKMWDYDYADNQQGSYKAKGGQEIILPGRSGEKNKGEIKYVVSNEVDRFGYIVTQDLAHKKYFGANIHDKKYNPVNWGMPSTAKLKEVQKSKRDAYGIMQVKEDAYKDVINSTYEYTERNGKWKKNENYDRYICDVLGIKNEESERPSWGAEKTVNDALKDPVTNLRIGMCYLYMQKKRFGKIEFALNAYNWGPSIMQNMLNQYGSIRRNYLIHLPRETLGHEKKYKKYMMYFGLNGYYGLDEVKVAFNERGSESHLNR